MHPAGKHAHASFLELPRSVTAACAQSACLAGNLLLALDLDPWLCAQIVARGNKAHNGVMQNSTLLCNAVESSLFDVCRWHLSLHTAVDSRLFAKSMASGNVAVHTIADDSRLRRAWPVATSLFTPPMIDVFERPPEVRWL